MAEHTRALVNERVQLEAACDRYITGVFGLVAGLVSRTECAARREAAVAAFDNFMHTFDGVAEEWKSDQPEPD